MNGIPQTRLALAALAVALLTGGCSTTDDPSRGGLISYWTHGEDAYDQRLQERQALLEQGRARSEAAEAEAADLQHEVDQRREEVVQQEARLQRLRGDMTGFERECKAMEAKSEAARKEQTRLMKDLAALRKEMRLMADVEMDENVAVEEQIRDRRKYIAELERDLKALRERASLLTTL